ncbi:hypothetical protein HELRODRAFT_166635 [Helobdella robusta]|uniref:TGS domain-containing protein n=1 Tax=Helobdella robusta TaxID=6412 RepID=T1EYB1_HELRO|nr:hypothetical protein HELRODRAFT_166635 [Helobdella robusta]ESO11622.1 hypothetical protein HELRODRAFT_166635 [Helobdella robusta]
MGILEKISEIEKEIARTQKNKATEYHLGLLKAKLAKYRAQLLEPTGKSGAKGEGFDVMKSGDARVALIGFPSVGKVSCGLKLNLDYLLEKLWEYLALIRVYTKKRGERPDFDGGLILRSGCTVEHTCHVVHRQLVDQFKYALVWGSSVKYSPQRVGLSHVMSHDDVIQIVKK